MKRKKKTHNKLNNKKTKQNVQEWWDDFQRCNQNARGKRENEAKETFD